MIKRLANIINKFSYLVILAILIVIWEVVSDGGLVPKFLLPSPYEVILAFKNDFALLCKHSVTTLFEAFAGLTAGIMIATLLAAIMDANNFIKNSVYPLLVISQTVPVIAIAPLLVLWFGYDVFPKILLIFIVCFFPITVGLLDGFKNVNTATINLFKSMGATNLQTFIHLKFPSALPSFFAGIKIAVSYAIVGAVISEWLGGTNGLGVYMIRVKKSYSYDKMFAVILLVSLISLALIKLVNKLEKIIMPYKNITK